MDYHCDIIAVGRGSFMVLDRERKADITLRSLALVSYLSAMD